MNYGVVYHHRCLCWHEMYRYVLCFWTLLVLHLRLISWLFLSNSGSRQQIWRVWKRLKTSINPLLSRNSESGIEVNDWPQVFWPSSLMSAFFIILGLDYSSHVFGLYPKAVTYHLICNSTQDSYLFLTLQFNFLVRGLTLYGIWI